MIRRLILALAAVILVLVVVGAVALYWLLSGDGVRRALEIQASTWLGQPVHIASARMQFVPRVAIHLGDVTVGEPGRVSLSTVDLSAPLAALVHGRIEDGDVLVSRSRVDMPLPFGLPSSTSDTSGGAVGSAPIQVVSIRTIRLRDIALVSRGRSLQVNADASLRGSDLTLARLAVSSGATSLQASGVVALSPRIDAQVRMVANRLDLDELLALANAFAPPTSEPGTARAAARIAARISAATARVAGVDGRNFAGQAEVDGNDVTLSPMSVEFFGGRYEGALSARFANTLSVRLRSRVTDLDLAQLASFGGAAGSISGRLSGAGTFAGSGDDIGAVLRRAAGSGTASITNGTIAHLDLLRTVVLFFGRPAPDAPASSDRFDRMDVSFSLADQIVRANAFALHAPDADMVGDGSLALASQALDGRVDISLSEELSKQAGTDLYRYTSEGNRIVLPATIGGKLGSPRLGIDATAAVRRGLRNEIQHRLGDLLDRFHGAPSP